MSLTFKLLSLAIRTAAKPIGNYIKRQAKEHDGFRKFAVSQAQRVHRIDMRMRLGILHDPAAQERMHEREQKAAEEKKRKAETPTVRTEAEQKRFEAEQAREETEGSKKEEALKPAKIKIRPLSETRAIELGANFFSEAFIFGVAAGLLIWDAWRSRKKESARRDDVAERLETLEVAVARLQSTVGSSPDALVELGERIKVMQREKTSKWWNPATWYGSSTEDASNEEAPSNAGDAQSSQKPAPEPAVPIETQPRSPEKLQGGKSEDAGSSKAAAPLPEKMNVVKATSKER